MTFPWADGSDFSPVLNPLDQPSNTPADPSAFVAVDDDDVELSDDDIDRLLLGDFGPLNLTAAAQPPAIVADSSEHTGAMIALLPSQADMDRLYVIGGEEDEELHLTIAYLGEAAKITPNARNMIIERAYDVAREIPVVDADLFGIATFNEKNNKKDTCVVGLISGNELPYAKMMLTMVAESALGDRMPDQHAPWIPHVTLAYTKDGIIAQTLGDREGSIRFDRVRVAFGEEVTDIPLYDGTAQTDTAEVYPVGDTQRAVTADAAVDAELGEYDGGWEGVLMVEDTDTGDGRMFSGGSVTWGDTSETIHPLQWAISNEGEHKGSVTAGRITKIWRNPENPRMVMGKGTFNVNDPNGMRAFQQTRDGFAGGVSVDPDQITDADVELEFDTPITNPLEQAMAKPTKTIFHAGRLRGATLVAFPALIEASIKLTKKSAPSLVATGSTVPWRAAIHEVRLGDEIDGLVASMAFGYVRELDEVVDRQQCRFLHHEISGDGEVGLPNLVACGQHIASINAGRTFGLQIDELRSAYDHMAQHITDAGLVPEAFALETDAVVASVPPQPPLEWFGNPNLSAPTPITVTEDGRVFGHAAAWNSCHTGFADTCVSPPFENDYGYFTTGEVLTAEGHRVAVGQITLGTSHAPTRGLSVAAAIDHYGDTGVAVADVTAGSDDHGIWISGAVRPGVEPERVQALRASALSGDWRRIGGNLRMVALLAVNVPGFPIPRVGTALNSGKQVSLVASGIVDRTTMTFEEELTLLANSCGIPLGKKQKKYSSLAAEVTALANELNIVDHDGNVHGKDGKFIGHAGGGGGADARLKELRKKADSDRGMTKDEMNELHRIERGKYYDDDDDDRNFVDD